MSGILFMREKVSWLGAFRLWHLNSPLPQIQLLPLSCFHIGTPLTGTSLPLCWGIFLCLLWNLLAVIRVTVLLYLTWCGTGEWDDKCPKMRFSERAGLWKKGPKRRGCVLERDSLGHLTSYSTMRLLARSALFPAKAITMLGLACRCSSFTHVFARAKVS